MEPHLPTRAPLVSLGDSVECGEYTLHSAFPAARNFTQGENVVSVVERAVGNSGTNIVCEKYFLQQNSFSEIEVSSSAVRLGKFVFRRETVTPFCSAWSGAGASTCDESKFAVAKRALLPVGFSFLLAAEGAEFEQGESFSLFEKNLRKSAMAAHKLFCEKKLACAARAFRGLGAGLTPSGDDYLCGALSAYSVLQSLGVRNTSSERSTVLENALGDNILSNSFLHAAAKGSFSERQKNFFDALFGVVPISVAEAARNVACSGHSSGTDYLVGFFTVLETDFLFGTRFCEKMKRNSKESENTACL
jgi:hypothetical protein